MLAICYNKSVIKYFHILVYHPNKPPGAQYDFSLTNTTTLSIYVEWFAHLFLFINNESSYLVLLNNLCRATSIAK